MAAVAQSHDRECAVCTNDFKIPKILPCGHVLCRDCVVSWIGLKSDAGCPLCTCPIVEHHGHSSQSSTDVADAFPTDYVMEAIIESARVRVKDEICNVCDNVRAEYLCIQCVEKMCHSCVKIHKKMVATRSHDVESLRTVTPERLAASRPALCADHGDKQAELFCVRHNLVICTSCGCNKHGDCPEIRYLDDQMMYAENKLGLLTEKLVKAEDILKQEIENLNVQIITASFTEQQNMALVDKTCDRLQKMVEECRKQRKKLFSDSFSKFKNSMYDVRKKLAKRLGKVTSHKHLVTRATTVRPRPALIPAAETLTDRVHNLNLSAELKAEPWVDPSPEIAKYCDDVGKLMKAELQSMTLQRSEVALDIQSPVLVFHKNCGINIRLTNCNTTAEKIELKDIGNVVVSRDAMVPNVLYEVRVDTVTATDSVLYLGVTSIPPTRFAMTNLRLNLKDSIIIMPRAIWYKEDRLNTPLGRGLKRLHVGSRVGLLVDSSQDLHLYVDGQDQGAATECVTQPCYAVFVLCDTVIKVTALPTSKRT